MLSVIKVSIEATKRTNREKKVEKILNTMKYLFKTMNQLKKLKIID